MLVYKNAANYPSLPQADQLAEAIDRLLALLAQPPARQAASADSAAGHASPVGPVGPAAAADKTHILRNDEILETASIVLSRHSKMLKRCSVLSVEKITEEPVLACN